MAPALETRSLLRGAHGTPVEVGCAAGEAGAIERAGLILAHRLFFPFLFFLFLCYHGPASRSAVDPAYVNDDIMLCMRHVVFLYLDSFFH